MEAHMHYTSGLAVLLHPFSFIPAHLTASYIELESVSPGFRHHLLQVSVGMAQHLCLLSAQDLWISNDTAGHLMKLKNIA